MSGRVALHGGGEFLPGDEPFLRAILEAAAEAVQAREDANRSATDAHDVRVAVVPTAAARSRPDLAAAHGVEALERVGAGLGFSVRALPVMVVDRSAAGEPADAERLRDADLIYLPGGDPDLLPATLAATAAWAAILAAHERGAVIAGASAGAMGLADRTWTPNGWLDGLGLIHGLIVVPHFAGFDRRGWHEAAEMLRRAGLGQLGLDERTGVLSPAAGERGWPVAGEGQAHWFSAGGDVIVARHGDRLDLPG